MFNQAQIPLLLEELRLSEQGLSDPETKAHVGKVIRLLEQSVEQVHTYIKFIGD